jgi:hypothetical protein
MLNHVLTKFHNKPPQHTWIEVDTWASKQGLGESNQLIGPPLNRDEIKPTRIILSISCSSPPDSKN